MSDMPDVIYSNNAKKYPVNDFSGEVNTGTWIDIEIDNGTTYIRKSIADELVDLLRKCHYGLPVNALELVKQCDEILIRYEQLMDRKSDGKL